MTEFLLIIGGMLIGFIIGIIAEYCAWEEQMTEYVNKEDVLDIINTMPQDLVHEHIYKLKGIHVDIVHCSECVWMKKNGFCFNPKQSGYRDNDYFCADGYNQALADIRGDAE